MYVHLFIQSQVVKIEFFDVEMWYVHCEWLNVLQNLMNNSVVCYLFLR